MFDQTSRYYSLPVAEITIDARDGTRRTVHYVRRRFIPDVISVIADEYMVNDGDRLDNLTAQYLGLPTLFWRICDSNHQLNPFGLLTEPGSSIIIDTLTSDSEA
ncbi:MAG: LysM domain-containing protein [Bacteroidetes bacterium]|nr:LysM domain-containing protein [Bacteroidota bacterium]HVZ41614.1 LysM domain-containing protein [Candidatus Kapabacteria bacterium]